MYFRLLKVGALTIPLSVMLGVLACTEKVIREVPVERTVIHEVVKEVPVTEFVKVEKEVERTVEVVQLVEVVKGCMKESTCIGETVVVTDEVQVSVRPDSVELGRRVVCQLAAEIKGRLEDAVMVLPTVAGPSSDWIERYQRLDAVLADALEGGEGCGIETTEVWEVASGSLVIP